MNKGFGDHLVKILKIKKSGHQKINYQDPPQYLKGFNVVQYDIRKKHFLAYPFLLSSRA
jgi:hypothetical protein